ncbi:MAG: hypothetical protein ACYCYN_00530 [Solirubrobacteraceae bacterium]
MGGLALLAGVVALALPAVGTARLVPRRGTAKSGAVRCPKQAKQALPLPDNAVAKAAEAALDEAAAKFKAINTEGATILTSELGEIDGAYVEHQCGKTVQRRTVVVQLRFPKMLPSASLSQGAVYVSRLHDGYHVWEVSPVA